MKPNHPRGKIFHAEVGVDAPAWMKDNQRRRRGVMRLGEIYESEVHQALWPLYPGYVHNPWIVFHDQDGRKWCQPDALIVDPRRSHITIVEVKLRHTLEAFVALYKLYLPVLQAAFGAFYRFSCIEICKWFDPAVPIDVSLRSAAHDAPVDTHNVYILQPT